MAFSQTDLDNIDAAIASGELTVELDGRKVTYRSITDLTAARKLIVGQINGATAGGTARAYRYNFATQRGF